MRMLGLDEIVNLKGKKDCSFLESDYDVVELECGSQLD